jgi:hypothetical protein
MHPGPQCSGRRWCSRHYLPPVPSQAPVLVPPLRYYWVQRVRDRRLQIWPPPRQPAWLSCPQHQTPEQPQLESRHPGLRQRNRPDQRCPRDLLRQQPRLPFATESGLNRWRLEAAQSVGQRTAAQPVSDRSGHRTTPGRTGTDQVADWPSGRVTGRAPPETAPADMAQAVARPTGRGERGWPCRCRHAAKARRRNASAVLAGSGHLQRRQCQLRPP